MKRALILMLTLGLQAGVHAQSTVQVQTGVPPTLEVQRLAPQLVAFAGGEVNFANLVNGLALGLPVTLTTPLSTGLTQVVSFTPLGTMSSLAIAQTLESARQALIARGVATPTAQQLGVILTGGALQTVAGTTQVNPIVGTTAALGTLTATTAPALLQPTQGLTVRNTSDSPLPRGISDTPASFSGTPPLPSTGVPAVATTPTTVSAPFATTPTAPAAAGATRPAPFAR